MRFERPRTARPTAEPLSAESGVARVLAGGADFMVQLRSGVVEPDLIVDIKLIGRMREIVAEAGGFRVGAGVSGAELGEHAGVRAPWPGTVYGAELIGSTQMQGRATMAGNLCNGSPAADAVPGLFTAAAIARIAGVDTSAECNALSKADSVACEERFVSTRRGFGLGGAAG